MQSDLPLSCEKFRPLLFLNVSFCSFLQVCCPPLTFHRMRKWRSLTGSSAGLGVVTSTRCRYPTHTLASARALPQCRLLTHSQTCTVRSERKHCDVNCVFLSLSLSLSLSQCVCMSERERVCFSWLECECMTWQAPHYWCYVIIIFTHVDICITDSGTGV